jgi:uncharacterized protein Smg (DUF494 family)
MLYEKIIEIIVYLLSEMKKNKQLGEIEVEQLSNLGYTQNEINTAFSWIYSKIYAGEKIFTEETVKSRSFRVLHDVEKNVITPEANGYLIQLRELGLITDMDIETIIDKIMLSAYNKIEVEDMKSYIAAYLLDLDDMNNSNRRIALNTNDTIN